MPRHSASSYGLLERLGTPPLRPLSPSSSLLLFPAPFPAPFDSAPVKTPLPLQTSPPPSRPSRLTIVELLSGFSGGGGGGLWGAARVRLAGKSLATAPRRMSKFSGPRTARRGREGGGARQPLLDGWPPAAECFFFTSFLWFLLLLLEPFGEEGGGGMWGGGGG